MDFEILMPFWGRFDHFREAVESVLAQDDADFRLTVVDDVYPDTTPGEWLQDLADPRVAYVRNEANLGPSKNYNACVARSEARYVTLFGCDDVMESGYVRRVRELLRDFPDSDLLQPGVRVIDETGQFVRPVGDRIKARLMPRGPYPRAVRGENLAVGLMRGNWTYFPSLVWKRERLVARRFREDLNVVQDLEMIAHIVATGGTVVVDDDAVFRYRRHSTSVSAVTGPDGTKFAQERTLFAEISEMYARQGWSRAARAARRHITSRANAAATIPGAIRARNGRALRSIVGHVLVPGARRSRTR